VNLSLLAKSGRFKQDLLDRLSFEVVYVPPLRDRQEDILVLSNHFALRMAFELEWQDMPQLTRAAEKQLEEYPWPGNIRELKNVVERAVYKSKSHKINEITFDPFVSSYADNLDPGLGQNTVREKTIQSFNDEENNKNESVKDLFKMPFKKAVKEFERILLSNALEKSRYNQKKAAKLLGLSYDQLRGLKKKHTRLLDSGNLFGSL